MRRPTVLLIDDHPLYIDALRVAVEPLFPARVEAEATLSGAFERLEQDRYDLILLDLSLPDAGGVESVGRVKEAAGPRAALVVVSGRDDASTVALVRALKADGFLSKSQPLTVLREQLTKISNGETVFPSDKTAEGLSEALALLTPAQARVLAAAATGKLNKQIAYDMGLAEPTVKAHMSAIIKRLGVANRTQAILAISGSV